MIEHVGKIRNKEKRLLKLKQEPVKREEKRETEEKSSKDRLSETP